MVVEFVGDAARQSYACYLRVFPRILEALKSYFRLFCSILSYTDKTKWFQKEINHDVVLENLTVLLEYLDFLLAEIVQTKTYL